MPPMSRSGYVLHGINIYMYILRPLLSEVKTTVIIITHSTHDNFTFSLICRPSGNEKAFLALKNNLKGRDILIDGCTLAQLGCNWATQPIVSM